MTKPDEIDEGADELGVEDDLEREPPAGDDVDGFLLKSGNLLGTMPVSRQLPPDKQRQVARDT